MIPHNNLVAHEHILAQRDAFPDFRSGTNMHPVPDTAALVNLRAIVNDGGRVDSYICHADQSLLKNYPRAGIATR